MKPLPALIGCAGGALVGCCAISVAALFAGAGHGTYIAAKVLFPFTMLFAIYCHSITTAWVMVAFIQFPVYGLLLGSAYQSPQFRFVAIVLALVHFAAAALCLASTDPTFS